MNVEGFRVTRLSAEDAPALQDLFERATDFFELCEGGPPRPDEALIELTHLPPGFSADDFYAFGFYRDLLDAIIVLLRDNRAARTWWIGLLLLDPALRHSGVGTRIVEATRAWLATQDAATIYIGVVPANTNALRFWHARGFEDVNTQPYTSTRGHKTEVVVMRRGV